MEKITNGTPSAGKVYLVGAGPGDPDLMTLKAAKLLARADVVIHDGLVSQEILEMASPSARRVSVAKKRSLHSVSQDQINNILIEEAGKGHLVIRLKGGDPFIFGRGGEEADDCIAAGVDVEVVPGISAALGCSAQARMPLTHRDASSAVSFVAPMPRRLSRN